MGSFSCYVYFVLPDFFPAAFAVGFLEALRDFGLAM
jgi:hypothetical protein